MLKTRTIYVGEVSIKSFFSKSKLLSGKIMNILIYCIHLITSLLIAVIGIPGNLTILYFFLIKCWKRINSYYLFIIYLAFSDLMVCITRFVQISILYFASESQIATLLCENTWFFATIISNTSIWILTGLSYDRYRKITKPLAKQLPRWCIHMACITPALIGYWIMYPYSQSMEWIPSLKGCDQVLEVPPRISVPAFTLHAILLCTLPISINIYTNYRITKHLDSEAGNTAQIQESKIFERNKRAASTLKSLTIIASITVFIPNVLLTILYGAYLMSKSHDVIPNEFFSGLSNLMYFNSTINAFVYWFRIKEFRSFYAKKARTFCCRK